MLEVFYPDARISSAYKIPYERYFEEGIKGIIFDIDNTLVPHDAPATDDAETLFKRLRDIGFKTCLISNNSAERVAPFAKAVNSQFVPKASKPLRRGYMEAMRLMGTDSSDTLYVGDQLFTDIWGANRCHLRTVLTDPIDRHEKKHIVLKRFLEKPILKQYEKYRIKNLQKERFP